MNEAKCRAFLKQIFWQSYLDENFYHAARKLGVDFSQWPETNEFRICKDFQKIAVEKSHTNAVFKLDLQHPESVSKSIITEDEIKLFYQENLNHLKALELSSKIKQDPSKTHELCDDFLNSKSSTKKVFSLNEIVETFVKENEEKLRTNIINIVIRGFEILSGLISGFNVGRVTIFTAHSGFGKSNLAINLIKNAIQTNLKCLCVNMEMEISDITKRFLQSEYLMKAKEFEHPSYIEKITANTNSWIQKGQSAFFTDGTSMSLNEISTMVSEIKRTNGLDIVFVDYDQKVISEVGDDSEEWRFIQKTVERLEAIAKKEKVHVVLFSQTDEEKNGQPRASKRAIQPASSVIYFHRDENDNTIFSFIKNRFGPVDKKILVKYDPATSFIIEDKILENFLPKPASAFKRRADVFG